MSRPAPLPAGAHTLLTASRQPNRPGQSPQHSGAPSTSHTCSSAFRAEPKIHKLTRPGNPASPPPPRRAEKPKLCWKRTNPVPYQLCDSTAFCQDGTVNQFDSFAGCCKSWNNTENVGPPKGDGVADIRCQLAPGVFDSPCWVPDLGAIKTTRRCGPGRSSSSAWGTTSRGRRAPPARLARCAGEPKGRACSAVTQACHLPAPLHRCTLFSDSGKCMMGEKAGAYGNEVCVPRRAAAAAAQLCVAAADLALAACSGCSRVRGAVALAPTAACRHLPRPPPATTMQASCCAKAFLKFGFSSCSNSAGANINRIFPSPPSPPSPKPPAVSISTKSVQAPPPRKPGKSPPAGPPLNMCYRRSTPTPYQRCDMGSCSGNGARRRRGADTRPRPAPWRALRTGARKAHRHCIATSPHYPAAPHAGIADPSEFKSFAACCKSWNNTVNTKVKGDGLTDFRCQVGGLVPSVSHRDGTAGGCWQAAGAAAH